MQTPPLRRTLSLVIFLEGNTSPPTPRGRGAIYCSSVKRFGRNPLSVAPAVTTLPPDSCWPNFLVLALHLYSYVASAKRTCRFRHVPGCLGVLQRRQSQKRSSRRRGACGGGDGGGNGRCSKYCAPSSHQQRQSSDRVADGTVYFRRFWSWCLPCNCCSRVPSPPVPSESTRPGPNEAQLGSRYCFWCGISCLL